MSTIYTLKCTSSAGDEATLEIEDKLNLGVFQDTWRCVEGQSVWGAPDHGGVTDWGKSGEETTKLYSGTATPHELVGFHSGIENGATGQGEKVFGGGGTFPDGRFEWYCSIVA